MNMNDVLQYAAYVLVAIGVMAFLVSVITQVIKELPCFKPVPTAVVVIVLSLVLCPAALVAPRVASHFSWVTFLARHRLPAICCGA